MIKKIRLLQVIPNMGIGGAETGCRHVAEHVQRHGAFSAIMTSGGHQLEFLDKSIKVFKWPTSKNIFFILLNIFYIFYLIKKNKINIVHARSRGPAWSCYLACKLSNTRFVTTFHGTYNFSSSIKKYYNSIMVKSDVTIAGSDFIKNHIKTHYDQTTNIKLIKRGIDINYFNPNNVSDIQKENLRKQIGFSNQNFLVLLPGRLTGWKGQNLFIEAANYLKKENRLSNIFFIILGGEDTKKNYKQQLTDLIYSYKLVDKVRMMEPMSDMPLAYSFCNLIVSASIEPEAFGRVSVEAQAMEKPILASAIGGSKETIIDQETGWVIEPNNIQALANKIFDISKMNSEKLSAMGKLGRKNVLQHYTQDQMCLKTLEIYQSLVY